MYHAIRRSNPPTSLGNVRELGWWGCGTWWAVLAPIRKGKAYPTQSQLPSNNTSSIGVFSIVTRSGHKFSDTISRALSAERKGDAYQPLSQRYQSLSLAILHFCSKLSYVQGSDVDPYISRLCRRSYKAYDDQNCSCECCPQGYRSFAYLWKGR